MKYVIGYASLLSKVSIKRLFPNVGNISHVSAHGHARCFNSYGTLSVNKGLADKKDEKLSHASAILKPNSTIRALAFELDDHDFKTYEKHEFRYSLREIDTVCMKTQKNIRAIMCYENVDHLIDTTLIGSDSIFDLYDRYNTHTFWHQSLLPAEIYLRHCIASARILGVDAVNNFLDTSYLHDRKTTIRRYLESAQINVEQYVRTSELSEVF